MRQVIGIVPRDAAASGQTDDILRQSRVPDLALPPRSLPVRVVCRNLSHFIS